MRKSSFRQREKRQDRGATMVEYTLLASLIALAGLVSIRSVGAQINGRFENLQGQMEAASGNLCPPDDPLYPNC